MRVDSYAHCGVSKYLPVEAVLTVMEKARVDRAVLVQHLGEFDNRYIERAVTDHPDRFVAVGLVDHRRDDWALVLDRLLESGAFRGIRVPEAALAENPAFCQGVLARSLVPMLDLPAGVGRAPAVSRLSRQHPDVPMVISHMGYPRVAGNRLLSGDEIVALAGLPSIAVLISGQSMFCRYPYTPLADLRDAVIRAFGPDRVVWGSNFPEMTDEEDYVRDLALIASQPSLSTAGGIDKVMGGTAHRMFFDGGAL
jgi:L-fuconolactonase